MAHIEKVNINGVLTDVEKMDHSAEEIDTGVGRLIPGGEIDVSLSKKMNVPSLIPTGANLDEYKMPGWYFCSSDVAAATIQNAPIPVAFSLTVEKLLDGAVFQTVKHWRLRNGFSTDTSIHVRCSYTTWEKWKSIPTGADLPRHNILHNWYFGPGVINQRGNPTYAGHGYTIDRWESSGELELDGSGVKRLLLNPNYGQFVQRVENFRAFVGRTVTASLLADAVVADELILIINDGKDQKAINVVDGMVSVTHTIHSAATWLMIGLQNNSKSNQATLRPISVKLEVGSESTLLNDPPPDPATELAKCQRYFVRLPFLHLETIGSACYGTTWLNLQLALPTQMRLINPAVTITCAPARIIDSLALPSHTNAAVRGTNANIGFPVQGTAGASYLYAGKDGYIDFDANI